MLILTSESTETDNKAENLVSVSDCGYCLNVDMHTGLQMFLKGLCKSVLFGIPMSITFFDCVGYVARVDGISMQPTLNPESRNTDYIFLSRWAVRHFQVRRGDVISMVSPKNPQQKLVKRVIALEGDILNPRDYRSHYVRIPEGYCWVEGDHTGRTYDSNSFGPVSLGMINAKATYIVWPPNRWQSIEAKLPYNRCPITTN